MAIRHVPNPRIIVRVALLSLGLLVASARPADAQKTDVVVLVNGDTLTCEVKLLDRGRLQVSTDHLGTVDIEWDKVASVTANRIFRVETATGLRLLGRLATSEPARLDVVQETGAVTVDQPDVVYIVPIGHSFWSRVDGSVNLGLSYTQSSGIAQLNLGANALHRRPNGQLTMSYSSFFTGDADGENTSRHAADIGLARYFRSQSVWLMQGGGMRNEELGYNFRGTLSGGVGRFLVHSNRAILMLGGGLSTSTETSVEGDTTQQLDALFVLRQSYFTYDSPKTDIATSINLYPSLSDWGRVRVEFDGRLNREIVKDFTIGFSLYNSFDSRPPTEDARKNDVGLSLTIGWTF